MWCGTFSPEASAAYDVTDISIIILDLVGVFFFWLSSMVKVRGRNSNRNTVKQVTEKGQKFSGDDDAAGIASWCQASSIRGCGIVLKLTGRDTFSTAGRVRSYSGWSWTFQIAHVSLHDCKVAPLVPQSSHVPFFFALCLTVFQLVIWHWTFTIGFYRKKSTRSNRMILQCSVPLNSKLLTRNALVFVKEFWKNERWPWAGRSWPEQLELKSRLLVLRESLKSKIWPSEKLLT